MNKYIYEEPLEDSHSGDVVGGPYGREKSSGGFYLRKGIVMKNELDIDYVLNEVSHVQASLSVMARSIDGVMGDDTSWLELQALIHHIGGAIDENLKGIARLMTDLREGGAKDYDYSDNFSKTAEVTQ